MKNYIKYFCLFLMMVGTSAYAWGKEGDVLKTYDTNSNTFSDGYSRKSGDNFVWWGQKNYYGANNATNHDNNLPTLADLPVVKAHNASATTSTTGLYYLYTSEAVANVGAIEITFSAKSGSSTVNAYIVSSSTAAASGSATWSKVTLSSSSANAQGKNVCNSNTYRFTFDVTETSAKYYGIVFVTSSYWRATGMQMKLIEGCPKIVTLKKGTETNCTFTLTPSSALSTCDENATTITITPNTGYGTPVVTESGASAAPTPGGSGNTQTLTYAANTTGTSTIAVSCSANDYVVLLEDNKGSGGDEGVDVTYDANTNLTSSVTVPTRTGFTFAGYWTSSDEGATFTTQLVNNTGAWIASVSGYTDGSKNWKYADDLTLYAKWTLNNYKLTVGAPNHVTIKATPEDKSDITEGNYDDEVPCYAIITLNAVVETGYTQAGWKITKDADESDVTVDYLYDEETMFMPPFDATVTATMYSDYVFSCSELTLTAHPETAGAPIFITSTAEKKVRSQGYITITGNGLTPGQALTFPGLPTQFEVLTSTGGTISVNGSGEINENAYIFYTPDAEETTDGLLKITGLNVSVGGAKPKQASLTQDIIGRHLPTAGYVIAAKKDNKWYALPSNMASTGTPAPSEIAVNDINNPSIAYTAASNIYGLEGPTNNNISGGNGQYVRLTMSINDGNEPAGPAPLFGSGSTAPIGKSDNAKATSNLSAGYWWALTQTNTNITNPQDAKYTIKCANNSNALKLYKTSDVWGQYAYGSDVAISELRIIPASNIIFTEAYFVEWGQHGGVIEVDAEGIDATSVTAHLGASIATASLSQTETSGKGRASIYDYTVNFGNDINFAATASNGALLTLEWKNGATTKAMTSLVVPKIIASTSNLSSHGASDGDWSSAEVHVLPGVTLTANAGDFGGDYAVTINHLEIYPGATVVVTKGDQESGTLKVKTLVLRNGWTRAGEKAYDVARLYITPSTASLAKSAIGDVWYTDWYIDYDQYYPIAVPWDVTLANITYRYCSVEPTVGHDKNIRLRYYDGEGRASSGQSQIGQNWKLYGASGADDVPTKLEPSKGYALTAKRPSGKAFSILRMPLGIPSNDWTALGEQGEVSSVHKNQVDVTGWGKGTADWYAMGWNFIGNPYMCTFNGNDDGIGGKLELQSGGTIKYATIPDVDFKNYDQVAIADANLKPASGFFVQANDAEAKTITFNASKIVPPSAPLRYTTQDEAIPEQEAYIRLSYEGGKDQMGLIIGEDYTENYEVNADLAKVLGDAGFVKTYMQYNGMDMAYVAINKMLAQEWIPVTVNIPTESEYTYSLTRSSEVAQLEGVYLIDYQNNNQVTNLIMDSYTFTSESGTFSNRFAINAIVGERQTPTEIDVVGANKNGDEPIKFLYHDKVFIWHRGVIYDATGKKVKTINK